MATTVPSGTTTVQPPTRRLTAIVIAAIGVVGVGVAAVVVADGDSQTGRPASVVVERAAPASLDAVQDPLIAQYGRPDTSMYDPLVAQYGTPEATTHVDPLIAQYGRP